MKKRVSTTDDETFRGRFRSNMRARHTLAILATGAAAVLSGTARADIEVTVQPNVKVDYNEAFSLDLAIPVSGDAFNTYEVTITFPADLIHYVGAVPPTANEGDLMTGACGQTFLSFTADTDSAGTDTLRITHALLCAGQNVTGPGTLYTLDFLARDVDGFGDVTVSAARFADAGVEVLPIVTGFARVAVGTFVAVPGAGDAGLLPPAHPNPFRSSTRLELTVARAGALRAEVFTVAGQRVRRLVDRSVSAGERVGVVWDGADDAGAPVTPGTYFLRVTEPERVRTQRIVRVR